MIAAKAVAFKLAAEPAFQERQQRTLQRRPDHRRAAARRRRGRGRDLGGQRRHRRAPGAGRPAGLRPGRAAGRGPAAPDRHHGEPERGAVRPAAADGLLGPADRDPGAGHPRVRRRRLPRGRRHHRRRARGPTSTTRSERRSGERVVRPRRPVPALPEPRLRPEPADGRGTAGAPGLPVAQPGPQALVRRGDRRRRRTRSGHRLLPGQEPRHHQHRRAGTGLAGRRQHGAEHRDHPVQLPVGRVLGDL